MHSVALACEVRGADAVNQEAKLKEARGAEVCRGAVRAVRNDARMHRHAQDGASVFEEFESTEVAVGQTAWHDGELIDSIGGREHLRLGPDGWVGQRLAP